MDLGKVQHLKRFREILSVSFHANNLIPIFKVKSTATMHITLMQCQRTIPKIQIVSKIVMIRFLIQLSIQEQISMSTSFRTISKFNLGFQIYELKLYEHEIIL